MTAIERGSAGGGGADRAEQRPTVRHADRDWRWSIRRTLVGADPFL